MPSNNYHSPDQEIDNSPVNGYRPHTPEKYIQKSVSLRESAIIDKLRKSTSFAKLLIIKQNNVIVRIEPTESVQLDENGLKEVVKYNGESI